MPNKVEATTADPLQCSARHATVHVVFRPLPVAAAFHCADLRACRGVVPTTQRAIILTATQFSVYDEVCGSLPHDT
jgi:hypothetical protein